MNCRKARLDWATRFWASSSTLVSPRSLPWRREKYAPKYTANRAFGRTQCAPRSLKGSTNETRGALEDSQKGHALRRSIRCGDTRRATPDDRPPARRSPQICGRGASTAHARALRRDRGQDRMPRTTATLGYLRYYGRAASCWSIVLDPRAMKVHYQAASPCTLSRAHVDPFRRRGLQARSRGAPRLWKPNKPPCCAVGSARTSCGACGRMR